MTRFIPTMTTSSDAAKQALARGIDGFNRWHADAIGHLDAAIENDPALALAHAVKGVAMVGGRNERFRPVVDGCLKAALAGRASASPYERVWIDVLDDMASNRFENAVLALEKLLIEHPTDLFAHRTIQQELFWSGEAAWMRDVGTRARSHWSGKEDDFSTFLSVYAFSLEESGDHSEAERTAREAVERDPNDPWAAHAVAHVLEMQGRAAEGITFLEPLCSNWDKANQIKHHLWWHLALFCIETGDHDRVLKLLDDEIRNPDSPMVQAVPDAYIDIQNVASMLMRLQLRGVDVGDRWATIADVCAQRLDNHCSPFTSAHAVMTLAGAGRIKDAKKVLASMEDCANTDTSVIGTRMRLAAVPAARTAFEWFSGQHTNALDAFMPARRDLWRMGGSHAQRDVFTQIAYDAARKTGQADAMRLMIEEMYGAGFQDPMARSLYADENTH